MNTVSKLLVSAGASVSLLSACFTGPRPTLIPEATLPAVSDVAAQSVISLLEQTSTAPFTITYEVVTKFGDLHTAVILAYEASLGTSITIAEVRYIYSADGTTSTCSTITGSCSPGIDESRVSDRQLVSTIFKKSAVDRIRQDLRVAVGSSTGSQISVAGHDATCTAIPVVDANGATQSKTYCAFSAFGVVATMDTADLAVTALSFDATVAGEQFAI